MQKSKSTKHGISKEYVGVESDRYDWNMVGDEHPSYEKAEYDAIHDRAKQWELKNSEAMGVLHEITDYIAIRYSSLIPAKESFGEGTMTAYKNGNGAVMGYTTGNFKNCGLGINVLGDDGTILIEAWNGDHGDDHTAQSVSEAEEYIDRFMRFIDPSYFASSNKNVNKSKKTKMSFNDMVAKCRDKNRGIAKDYATTRSGMLEDFADARIRDGSYSSAWDDMERQREAYNDEQDYEELVSIAHELSDYISIRYTSMWVIEDITVHKLSGETPWVSFEFGSQDYNGNIQVTVKPNAGTYLTHDVIITIFSHGNGARSQRIEVYTVQDAEDAIDIALRRIQPEYFA